MSIELITSNFLLAVIRLLHNNSWSTVNKANLKSRFSLLYTRHPTKQRLNEWDENTKTSSQVDKSLNKLVPINRNLHHTMYCRVIRNYLWKSLWVRRCFLHSMMMRHANCIMIKQMVGELHDYRLKYSSCSTNAFSYREWQKLQDDDTVSSSAVAVIESDAYVVDQ